MVENDFSPIVIYSDIPILSGTIWTNVNFLFLVQVLFRLHRWFPISWFKKNTLISGVLLWRQLMKRQLITSNVRQKIVIFSLLFFSVIWNIYKLNVLKTKCKLNCQNDFLGKLFLNSGNTSVYFFYVFITEI